MKISIISQKGGSGKSTVAINLALAVAGLPGKPRVALVDADEQLSCMQTLSGHQRENLFLYETKAKPHRLIEKLKEGTIFIDTAPHSDELMYQVAAVSHLVIIPVQPSPLDVRAMARTVKVLGMIKEKYNPKLKTRLLINRITLRTTLAGEIRETLARLYPGVPVLESMLHNREAYKQSLITGQSVIEYDRASAAARELGALLVEIGKIVKLNK
jgi:chromosome partitioning protein